MCADNSNTVLLMISVTRLETIVFFFLLHDYCFILWGEQWLYMLSIAKDIFFRSVAKPGSHDNQISQG